MSLFKDILNDVFRLKGHGISNLLTNSLEGRKNTSNALMTIHQHVIKHESGKKDEWEFLLLFL